MNGKRLLNVVFVVAASLYYYEREKNISKNGKFKIPCWACNKPDLVKMEFNYPKKRKPILLLLLLFGKFIVVHANQIKHTHTHTQRTVVVFFFSFCELAVQQHSTVNIQTKNLPHLKWLKKCLNNRNIHRKNHLQQTNKKSILLRFILLVFLHSKYNKKKKKTIEIK